MPVPIFWLCVAIIVWTYFGYPAAVGLRRRLRPRPVRGDRTGTARSISIVLAVRNERDRVRPRIENLLAQVEPATDVELLVVCNDCADGTEVVAAAVAAADPRVRVLESPAAEGKAGAIALGAAEASGEVLVFADARQTFAPGAVSALLAPFADPAVGAVTGRLVVARSDSPAVDGFRSYWGYETWIRMAESETGSLVSVTGAIYAVRRELFDAPPPGLILDDVYVPVRVGMRGYRVVMAPDAVAYDIPSPGGGAEFRRRVRTLAGNIQILYALPGILSPGRNPLFFRYVSHKLLRLATPLALLGALAAALVLRGPFYGSYAAAVLLVTGAGLLGLVFPVKLLSFPAALVTGQAAIVVALFRGRASAADIWRPARAETRQPHGTKTEPPS